MQVAAPGHVFGSLSPVGAQRANLRRRLKGVVQQPVGAQLQQPLAFLHIAFAPRQTLRMPRIHQIHLKALLFHDVVERNPVHPCGLQDDCLHLAFLQPRGQAIEVGGETLKPSHRLRVAVRSNCNVMGFVANINSCGIRMDYLQPGILGL